LVTRDIDVIILELAKIYATVTFTITPYKDSMAREVKPFAPASSKRYKAMELLA